MSKNASPSLRSPLINRLIARLQQWRWRIATIATRATKRTIDLLVVIPALIALMPLFIVLAILIKLYDRGPVLFWQRRVGLGGREFAFPKFRSMRVDAEAVLQQIRAQNQHGQDGVTFKMKHDPRVTPIGRFIRRFSLDELPQLWCVAKGDMSLVGPRPPLPSETSRYNMIDRYRLSVKPGLTCIWQVNGRSEIPFDQQVEMDIAYIQQQSIGTDLKLLAKTIPAVVKGRGAY